MKASKTFEAFLRTHGMTLEDGTNHCLIKKNGKALASVVRTPRETYTYRQTVRTLVRAGLLPQSAKSVKF